MSHGEDAVERKDQRFDHHYRPVVGIFHEEGPLTIEFARKFVDASVAKWYQDIRQYGDVYSVSSPNVTVLAKSGDNVVWQVTIAGLVKDVSENIPGAIQQLVDSTVARGGRVRLDHSGEAVRRAIESAGGSSAIHLPLGQSPVRAAVHSFAIQQSLDAAQLNAAANAARLSAGMLAPVQSRPAVDTEAAQPDNPVKEEPGPVPTTGDTRHGLPSIRGY